MNEQAFLCTEYVHPQNVSAACVSVNVPVGGGGLRQELNFGEAAEGGVVPSCTFENTCVAHPIKLFKNQASGRQLGSSL